MDKTGNNNLNYLTNNNVYDIDPIMENLSILDTAIGSVGEIKVPGISIDKTVVYSINYLYDKINGLELVDTSITVSGEDKDLSQVIKDLKVEDKRIDDRIGANTTLINSSSNTAYGVLEDFDDIFGDLKSYRGFGFTNKQSLRSYLTKVDELVQNQAGQLTALADLTSLHSAELNGGNAEFTALNQRLESLISEFKAIRGGE